MAVAKTNPATAIEPTPEATTEEEKIAEQLIEASFPDLVKELGSELEVINDFYESLGFPYCKKCGERRRTYDGTNAFCPIAKPNCAGFSA